MCVIIAICCKKYCQSGKYSFHTAAKEFNDLKCYTGHYEPVAMERKKVQTTARDGMSDVI